MKTSNHPLYGTWRAMRDRCQRVTSTNYMYYGGRGIYVCKEWDSSFIQFLTDMGEKPTRFTLDRIDNNGPYCKQNCRWADRTTQQLNTRKTLGAKGCYFSCGSWQAKFKVNKKVISKRFDTEEEARRWYENNKPIRSC